MMRKQVIKWRFCGDRTWHEEHYIHAGAINYAGAADYCCIGWIPDEVRING